MLSNNYSIRFRMTASFGLILMMFMIYSVLTYNRLKNAERRLDEIEFTSVPLLLATHELRLAVSEMQGGYTDLAATRQENEDGLREIRESRKVFSQAMEKLNASCGGERDCLQRLQSMAGQFEIFQSRGVQMSQAFIHGSAESGVEQMERFDTVAQKLDVMVSEVEKDMQTGLEEKVHDVHEAMQSTLQRNFLTTAAVAFFSLLLGQLLIRSITSPVQRLLAFSDRLGKGDFTVKV